MLKATLRKVRGLQEESGQGLVEYVMVLSMVSILIVGSLMALQGGIQTLFDTALPWPG